MMHFKFLLRPKESIEASQDNRGNRPQRRVLSAATPRTLLCANDILLHLKKGPKLCFLREGGLSLSITNSVTVCNSTHDAVISAT